MAKQKRSPRATRTRQAWQPDPWDALTMFLDLKHGKVSISTADHEKARRYTWHTRKNNETGYVSVKASIRKAGKVKTVYLARLIVPPSAGFTTHHRNGNTLDNTRANLEAIKIEENATFTKARENKFDRFFRTGNPDGGGDF